MSYRVIVVEIEGETDSPHQIYEQEVEVIDLARVIDAVNAPVPHKRVRRKTAEVI